MHHNETVKSVLLLSTSTRIGQDAACSAFSGSGGISSTAEDWTGPVTVDDDDTLTNKMGKNFNRNRGYQTWSRKQ